MKAKSKTHWTFRVIAPDGSIKGESPFTPNSNTQEGGIDFLNQTLSGVGYTASFFCGLINDDIGFVDPTDTAARITMGAPNYPTTNNWSECVAYSEATRQLVIFSPVVNVAPPNPFLFSVDNFTSVCQFTMNAAGVLGGGLMGTDSTKGGTGGILFTNDAALVALAYSAGDTVRVGIMTGITNRPM